MTGLPQRMAEEAEEKERERGNASEEEEVVPGRIVIPLDATGHNLERPLRWMRELIDLLPEDTVILRIEQADYRAALNVWCRSVEFPIPVRGQMEHEGIVEFALLSSRPGQVWSSVVKVTWPKREDD